MTPSSRPETEVSSLGSPSEASAEPQTPSEPASGLTTSSIAAGQATSNENSPSATSAGVGPVALHLQLYASVAHNFGRALMLAVHPEEIVLACKEAVIEYIIAQNTLYDRFPHLASPHAPRYSDERVRRIIEGTELCVPVVEMMELIDNITTPRSQFLEDKSGIALAADSFWLLQKFDRVFLQLLPLFRPARLDLA